MFAGLPLSIHLMISGLGTQNSSGLLLRLVFQYAVMSAQEVIFIVYRKEPCT